MENVSIGQKVLWKSANGYTPDEGIPCEVRGVNPISQRALIIATTPRADQRPHFAHGVSFDELQPLTAESAADA